MFQIKTLTAPGMIFKMIDEDDGGPVDVEEFIEAVRKYKGFDEEQISLQRLKVIFKAFDAEGEGEMREKNKLTL